MTSLTVLLCVKWTITKWTWLLQWHSFFSLPLQDKYCSLRGTVYLSIAASLEQNLSFGDVTQGERIVHPGHFILISSNYFYLCSWFWYRLATATKSLTAWNVVIRTNYNFTDLPGLTATSHLVKNLHFVLDLRLIGGACYSTHMHELFNYPSF